jgi:hypothetical protein
VAIPTGTKHFYEFGPFSADLEERTLLREGQIVPLPPKAFDLLLVLIQHSGHLVSKDDLMNTVWPDTFVEEANLSHNFCCNSSRVTSLPGLPASIANTWMACPDSFSRTSSLRSSPLSADNSKRPKRTTPRTCFSSGMSHQL